MTKAAKKAAKKVAKRKTKQGNPQSQDKRPRGRPSDYRPEYCEDVIEFCRQTGKSLTAFAGSIGTFRQRLNAWAAEHKEFREALECAKAARANKLEDEVMECQNGPAMNARLLALKNAAPDDWVDRTDHRIGGLPGAPPIATAAVDVSHLSPDQVYAHVLNGAPLPEPKNDKETDH